MATANGGHRPAVDPGSSASGGGAGDLPGGLPGGIPTPATTEDGFAAYSTALSATVAIGCTLLLLNMLVFACVFKQRDKHRETGSGGSGAGGGGGPDVGGGGGAGSIGTLKKRAENGQIHSGVCTTDHLQILPGGMATVTASTVQHPHHFHGHPHRLAHLPPPDVAELPRGYATLPHPTPSTTSQPVMTGPTPASSSSVAEATGTLPRAPPPPKTPKLPTATPTQIPQVPSQQTGGSAVPMQHLDSGGTLKKRGANTDASMIPGHHQHSRMEEFRV